MPQDYTKETTLSREQPIIFEAGLTLERRENIITLTKTLHFQRRARKFRYLRFSDSSVAPIPKEETR